MTHEKKLASILAAVQTDPGNRGLARDPTDNLFTATAGDFEKACYGITGTPRLRVTTSFYIPSATPPAYETDGPLGALFLLRAARALGGRAELWAEKPVGRALAAAETADPDADLEPDGDWTPEHYIWIERAGPAADGRCYTMSGRDITAHLTASDAVVERGPRGNRTIGIGDGGNEVGMGRVPHDTIVKNIPNGDLIHCRVPTDRLIVCGVSNWGAYALAGGLFALRGEKPPANLFDPDLERRLLEVMVREGPLVDGVTGKQTATVDGLSWDEYVKPLIRIREVLES